MPKHGDSFDLSDAVYPSLLEVFEKGGTTGDTTSTSYGYVLDGVAQVEVSGFHFNLKEGGFFCVPGKFELSPNGIVVLIRKLGYRGMFVAGCTEKIGRLSYIDGCSDTILVMPPRLGDPVLNYLHFPKGVNQTQHTHPTYRLGIVAEGAGVAYAPGWREQLSKGCVFQLDPHEVHSFQTLEGEVAMDVIAFHPDSDWGPTDAIHPMLNRTYIGPTRQ